jgi:hypothetical protein
MGKCEWLTLISEEDLNKFKARLAQLRKDEDGHLLMAPNFQADKSYRSYQMYFLAQHGRWPGVLKKTCNKEGCVVHYKEQGHVLTPDDVKEIKDAPEYWGVVTALAEKFGVSKARITQIRKGK